MSISENLEAVRRRIAAAAERAGRDPSLVCLIGASSASKGVTRQKVEAALAAGLVDFGENRVQEAEARLAELGSLAEKATWHFIGHLQANKVKAATRLFATIQSVDSLKLAERLSASSSGKILPILLEVNVAGEASKYGLPPSNVGAIVAAVRHLPNLDLVGLMTVAPAVPDPEDVRPVFRQLRQLAAANGLPELSMGMTDDFEVAVEEGATMVRIGRAIFGEPS